MDTWLGFTRPLRVVSQLTLWCQICGQECCSTTTAAGVACEVSDTLPYDADAALRKMPLKDPEPLSSETPKRFADFKNSVASTLVLGGTEAPKARDSSNICGYGKEEAISQHNLPHP